MNSASQIPAWLKAAKACLQKPLDTLRGELTSDVNAAARDHSQELMRIWRLRRWQASWLQLSR
jgi:hypothetical protein